MTETAADIGYDSSFGIEGSTAGTYVDVAEVTSINGFGFSRESIDATHLKSPDAYMEFIAGMKQGQPVTINLNYIPSASDALVTAFEAKKGKYQITAPNGVMMRFSGFCTAYEVGEFNNEKMTATATFQPSGKPTLHAAVGG